MIIVQAQTYKFLTSDYNYLFFKLVRATIKLLNVLLELSNKCLVNELVIYSPKLYERSPSI